jgi:hypothetical protein
MNWPFEDYHVFAVVRHPFTMLNSLYNYGHPDRDGSYWWERHWNILLQNTPVPSLQRVATNPVPFRDWVLEFDFGRFTLDPFVLDGRGCVRANTILRFERIDTEFAQLASVLRLPGTPLLPRMKVGSGAQRPFDQDMRARVAEVFSTDIALGGYQL